jgi:hypothetical protein
MTSIAQNFMFVGRVVSGFWGPENCCFPWESEVVYKTVLSATALARDFLDVLQKCMSFMLVVHSALTLIQFAFLWLVVEGCIFGPATVVAVVKAEARVRLQMFTQFDQSFSYFSVLTSDICNAETSHLECFTVMVN